MDTSDAGPERGPWCLVWSVAPLRMALLLDPQGRLLHAAPVTNYTRWPERADVERVRDADPKSEELEIWSVERWEEFMARRTRIRRKVVVRKEHQ